jgi:hypothetical protein
MFQTKVVDKIKKHILCSLTFFLKNPAIFERFKNIVQSDRPQMTVWRMRFSCWITKATNTHSEYIIIISFPLQQWLHERALCYMARTLPILFRQVPAFWRNLLPLSQCSKLQIYPAYTNKYTNAHLSIICLKHCDVYSNKKKHMHHLSCKFLHLK